MGTGFILGVMRMFWNDTGMILNVLETTEFLL